jgi:hypothetical protein
VWGVDVDEGGGFGFGFLYLWGCGGAAGLDVMLVEVALFWLGSGVCVWILRKVRTMLTPWI